MLIILDRFTNLAHMLIFHIYFIKINNNIQKYTSPLLCLSSVFSQK